VTTRNGLVADVLLSLSGYLSDQELMGTLTGAVTSSATTFTVAGSAFPDGVGFNPGLVEVGDELMQVRSIDTGTGVFSNVIRGMHGTTPTAWPPGTIVRDNPRIPTAKVYAEINNALREVYPQLYGIGSYEFPTTGGLLTYDLPATVTGVLSVRWQTRGPSGVWMPSRRWQYTPTAPGVSASGRQLTVFDVPTVSNVQVVTQETPGEFTSDTAFDVTTKLPAFCQETVVLGAAFRCANYLDAGRVAERTAEGDLMGQQGTQFVSGTKYATHLYAMYQERLKAAAARLAAEYQVGTLHYQM
jgi:hypothetical protein